MVGMQVEQILITRDDESRLGGECASKHVVIIGIATGRFRQGLRINNVGEALVILHERNGGKTCGTHLVREFIARDDFR